MTTQPDTDTSTTGEPTSPLLPRDSAHPARKPSIDTTTRAINATPIELDSTPVSPATSAKRADSWPARRDRSGSTNSASGGTSESGAAAAAAVAAPDIDDELAEGAHGEAARVRDARHALLERRRHDAGVLVDIPDSPDAEDFEVAEGMEGLRVAAKAGGEEEEEEDKS